MRQDLDIKKPSDPSELAYPIKEETYQSLRFVEFPELIVKLQSGLFSRPQSEQAAFKEDIGFAFLFIARSINNFRFTYCECFV